jgi:hypothetical protein
MTKKQLAGLAFNEMSYYLKERLEGIQFFTLIQLHQQNLACENRCKDTQKTTRHNVNYDQGSSDDEPKEVYATAKPSSCSSLHPVQKNRQEMKFTFNVAKYDKIFGELLKSGNIKTTHTIPHAEELKRKAYCK